MPDSPVDPASRPPAPQDSPSALEALKRLAARPAPFERYTLEGEIARGGMGAVLRVYDQDLQRHLAMKVILGQADTARSGETPPLDSRHVARFLEEAQITSQLDHPGIVPVHEIGLDAKGGVYFTMKLVKGKTLKDVFDELAAGHGDWNEPRVLGLILKACEAMAYAHYKGVIHRDLKPANVMVGRFGEVFVMDWGLARLLDREDGKDLRIRPLPAATSALRSDRHALGDQSPDSPLMTMDGDVVGTPAYMSPEQAAGRVAEIGPQSDAYAVGAMLYQMLAGHMPFVPSGARLNNYAVWQRVQEGPPRSLDEVAPHAAPELVAICEKAMAREPAHRYADTQALAIDLRAYVEGRVVAAYETGAWAETKKWVQRNRRLAASLAVAVLLLVAGLTGSLVFKARADRRASDLRLANATIREREAGTQKARAEADKRAREALASLYVAAVTGAQSARRLNEPASVRRLLDSAPEELRNWEWHYLDAVSDTSLFALQDARSASFSPDGSRIVTASSDKTARVWDAASGKELVRFDGHTGEVTGACFSPDGSRVVTSSDDKTARVWEATSGKELARLQCKESQKSASFSPDGSRVVTRSYGYAHVWEPTSGRELARMGHPIVNSATFSGDGSCIVMAFADSSAAVWDARRGKELARLEGHAGDVHSASFNPDGSRIVTSSYDGTSRVWEAASGKELARLEGHADRVTCASFSPDGSRVVTSSDDKTTRIWDATSGKELARLEGHAGRVTCASFSPDGSRIVTGSEDHTVRLWDAVNGKVLAQFEGHADNVSSASFSADGSRILTVSEDHTARLWDATREEQLAWFQGHTGGVTSASFSPDGSRIVTASSDKTARVWDSTGGKELVRLEGHSGQVNVASFSSDGSLIVTASDDNTARIWRSLSGKELARVAGQAGDRRVWDPTDGRELASIAGRTDWMSRATFSSDGARVVTSSSDKTARVWDVTAGKELVRLQGHTNYVTSAVFSADGSRIATASDDRTARLWDATSGKELVRLEGHARGVTSASFSPDGSRIVTASSDKTARVWDAASGKELVRFDGHTGEVTGACFSPDGSRVVTSSDDKTARVWEATSGKELARLQCKESQKSASFSPDGSRVVTVSEDQTMRVWDGVPYRVRFPERQALLAARPAGRRLVEEALVRSVGFADAEARLKNDASLEPLVRRAALAALAERAGSGRRLAEQLRGRRLERTWLARLAGIESWPSESVEEASLDSDAGLPTDAAALNDLAWSLVDPNVPPSGDEVRALRLARRAVEAAAAGRAAPYRDTLARALYRLGRFDEALAEQRRAFAEASPDEAHDYEGYLHRLESDIAQWRDESGALRLPMITERMQVLERDIATLEHDPDVHRWLEEPGGR